MNTEVQLTARMLRSATFLPWLSAALTIVTAAALLFDLGHAFVLSVAIVLGVAGCVYGFRVALDAWLFEDLIAGRLTTSELDAFLGRADRPWPDRCRGARRLMIRAAAAAALQLLAMVVARWMR